MEGPTVPHTPSPYSVDYLLDQYQELKAQAVACDLAFPVMLALGLPDPVAHAWVPMGVHPAQQAVVTLARATGATWACLLVDAYVSITDDASQVAPGKAAADYASGAEHATEALIATWVSLAGPPVLLVRPYTVEGTTVVWLDELSTDSRFTPGIGPVTGAVPTLLQQALQASRADLN